MATKNRFIGSFYRRGGQIRDKWDNKRIEKTTYRQKKTGYVVDAQGKFIGIEKPHQHTYGEDVKKIKKPKGWHGDSIRHSVAARKGKLR